MTKFSKKVDPKQFISMKKLIAKAAEGKISKRHTAYDAGSSSFTAYIYDKRSGTYTSVNLGSSGDLETLNDSLAATTLKEWLQEVRKEVSSSSKRK